MATELVKYEAARHALAIASSVDEVKDIHDKAKALRLYAQQANNTEMEEQCIKLRLHAEKRLGEMMAEQKANGHMATGARGIGPIAGSQIPRNGPPTLQATGIDKNLAKRARQARKLSDEEINRRAEIETRKAKREAAAKKAVQLHKQGMTKKAARQSVGGFSDTVMRKASTYQEGLEAGLREQIKQGELAHAKAENVEKQMLREGLKNVSAENKILKRQIASLEAEAKLPPGANKRLQAMLRRFRTQDRAVLNHRIKSNDEQRRKADDAARRAYGCVDDEIMGLWQTCMHPDGHPSTKIKERAFRELTERKDKLLGKPRK